MYSITHASLLLTLRSRTQPSAARGSAPNKALGRAEEKYQCQGITPHSELLHGHQLHREHPRSESIGTWSMGGPQMHIAAYLSSLLASCTAAFLTML